MKKYLTGMILAAFLFAVSMPLQVFAAENAIQLEPTGNQVAVKLTLPNAAGEKISSLQLTLEIAPCQSADFIFDAAVTGTNAICKAYYHENNAGGILNLYIAGTNPLYQNGAETLLLGNAVINHAENSATTVKAANVEIVRGTKVEALDELYAETTIGTDSGETPTEPGGNPSGPSTPLQTPEPTETPGATESPEPTGPPEPTGTETPAVTPTPSAPADGSSLKTPKVPKLANLKSGIRITWTRVPHATGYRVYRKTANGAWKKIAALKGNRNVTYIDKAIKNKNGVRYFYSIQAYNGETASTYNPTGTPVMRMSAQAISKPASKRPGNALIKWKRNKKATGYQIEYSTSKQFKNSRIARVKSGKQTSKTLKNLKSGKTYYFRVRSYKKVGKTTYKSAWSNKKKVRIK